MLHACIGSKRNTVIYLLTAILFTSFMLGGTREARAAAVLELYTPYLDISASPGESITYPIELINHSSTTLKTALSVKGKDGWVQELTADGRQVKQIAVKPGESQSAELRLQVPLKVEKGSYTFTVNATGANPLDLHVDVTEKGTYSSAFTIEQSNMEGHADSTFTFTANLQNRTAEEQTYSLTAAADPGWDIRFKSGGNNVTSVTAEPNASETITIEAVPPENASAGTFVIPVSASNNSTSASAELEVVITGTFDLQLTTADERLNTDVTAGSTRRLDLVVTNTGTSALSEVNMSAQSPSGWEVSFEPSSIRMIEPGQTKTVQAIIKADSKAMPGDYAVSLSAASPEKTSQASIRVAVKSSVLWGWVGILIVIAVAGFIAYLIRRYGRR
ncbi:COG1470 family protein [Paenibacillus tarimensis]|uniref:COG1470 family protein n=1 Tax=Paenibacillus tarimensis TaxID=416012 RepID=UPI001F2E413F|nr:NEW3 domain-containing protein [Paenibacillus tarimensis]MCF2942461.1 NEW3 domain-containing protein [Paenibacillus tarimensis]